MNFYELVKHSNGDEAIMWKSVRHISETIDKIKEIHPDIALKFMEEQYELMNGKHLNEWVAKVLVTNMWHKNASGDEVIGEQFSPEDALAILSGQTPEQQAKCKWDAYVAVNAFAHDLGKSGVSLSKLDLFKLAKAFWFGDDDLSDSLHKVYWYFKDQIFKID